MSKGLPRWAFRREHKSLRAPSFTPVPALAGAAGEWVGPEPTGTFEYRFTYIWGKQEIWFHNPGPIGNQSLSPQLARYQPYLESPPSPKSVQINNSVSPSSNAQRIDIVLPDIDFVLGFHDPLSGTLRDTHSGIKKRIYRRRVVEGLPTPGPNTASNIETPNDFFLLGEVDGHITSYTDRGVDTPDYGVPLQPTHGYQTVRLWPTPDKNYTVEVRCIRRPKALTDAQDYPLIHEDAIDCLITRAIAYLYESQGNASMAQYSLTAYQENLFALGKRYGDLRSKSRPRRKRPARVRRNINLRRLLTISKG